MNKEFKSRICDLGKCWQCLTSRTKNINIYRNVHFYSNLLSSMVLWSVTIVTIWNIYWNILHFQKIVQGRAVTNLKSAIPWDNINSDIKFGHQISRCRVFSNEDSHLILLSHQPVNMDKTGSSPGYVSTAETHWKWNLHIKFCTLILV